MQLLSGGGMFATVPTGRLSADGSADRQHRHDREQGMAHGKGAACTYGGAHS